MSVEKRPFTKPLPYDDIELHRIVLTVESSQPCRFCQATSHCINASPVTRNTCQVSYLWATTAPPRRNG